ncbi:MAG: hypothetical protein P8M34_07150 [Saprospiraceae bacterium]|nr:hypothetical protein [Saprospiraceae bacterium]
MKEYESLNDFKNVLGKKEVRKIAVQSLNLTSLDESMMQIDFKECLFLGCNMSPDLVDHLKQNNYIFPKLNVPYNIYPNRLYTKETLYKGYKPKSEKSYELTPDKQIYNHFKKTGIESDSIHETLARWLHDHSITDATYDFLSEYEERKVIAIMGGHSLSRKSNNYQKVAEISKELTEKGYILISGGGPGAMEATHVGSWFAGKDEDDMEDAIEHLKKAPKYDHPKWLSTAFEVIEKYPCGPYESLGIPTWLYGHEPPTPFATYIAKYFANSVREEGLLAVAKGGVIFAPGSAGTMQEIFQELAQNHYESFGKASPMVFLDEDYWTEDRPIYPVIKSMKKSGALNNLNIGLYDDEDDVINHLLDFNKI